MAGLRITDAATIEIVEMVLAGSANKQIVGYINDAGGKAVELSESPAPASMHIEAAPLSHACILVYAPDGPCGIPYPAIRSALAF